MKLTIHSVSSWDYPNIRVWDPIDPESIAVRVNIDIGEANRKGTERFSIGIATPKGLSKNEPINGILATSPLLVVDSYDYNNLWNWLNDTIKSCESDTWNESVEKLRRHFDYEYDN